MENKFKEFETRLASFRDELVSNIVGLVERMPDKIVHFNESNPNYNDSDTYEIDGLWDEPVTIQHVTTTKVQTPELYIELKNLSTEDLVSLYGDVYIMVKGF
jgi:hypothetical protein